MFHIILQKIWAGMSYNVPAVYDVFASPDKGLRSKTRAGKMWVKGGVGMERSGMT
jgi:hypothetical protein